MTKVKKQPGWLNRAEMSATLDITVVTLDRWKVPSVGTIGRQKFFTCADVLKNRLTNQKKALDKVKPSAQFEDSDIDDVRKEKLKEETIRLQLQNSILEGRSLPAWAVTEVLSAILSESGVILDTLPATIQRKFPEIEKRVIDMIEAVVIQHMNNIAQLDKKIEDILDDVIKEAEERIR